LLLWLLAGQLRVGLVTLFAQMQQRKCLQRPQSLGLLRVLQLQLVLWELMEL